MQNLLEIVLIGYSLFTLYGVALKPNFYWESRRIARTRAILGDQKTERLYLGMAALTLGVGLLALFNVIG